MENSSLSILSLFKLHHFCVPQYQRAYAWETEKQGNNQVPMYLEDLRQQISAQAFNPNKNYYLGTLLLHEQKVNEETFLDVVDGQQRLTTTVILLAAAVARSQETNGRIFSNENLYAQLRQYFIFNEIEKTQKFRTINEDNAFFRCYILKLENTQLQATSPSAQRLKAAYDYFKSEVKDDEWESLVNSLLKTTVMVYSVTNASDATLIFELQNDRGKSLTNLESLKSYLMHLIYLNTEKPDENLGVIQTHFANIYRDIEQQATKYRLPKEDAILAYHCAAYMKWSVDEWRNPKDLIKSVIAKVNKDSLRQWVLEFVAQLRLTYKTFSDIYNELDTCPDFANLYVLNRMATFWPLLIRAYTEDNTEKKANFRKACQLMEVYALRGYGIGNVRSDTGLSNYYRAARDFKGNFNDLHNFLHSMCFYRDIEERFIAGIDKPLLFLHHRNEALYILWRYENYLRTLPGNKSPRIQWRDFVLHADVASKLNIEHIAAQNNALSTKEVEWDPGVPKLFSEVCLHRLGNLVIDATSSNASKGKQDFSDKLENLTHSIYLSQSELIKWAEKTEDKYHWTISSVKSRHERLKAFVLEYWDPTKYHKPTKIVDVDALSETETEVLQQGEVVVENN